jgi:hypothetical protein
MIDEIRRLHVLTLVIERNRELQRLLQYQSPRAENRIEPELGILAIPSARYAAQVAMKPRSVLRIAFRKP